MRSFHSLNEREILALAISLEERRTRLCRLCRRISPGTSGSAAVFEGMQEEESGHRRRLIELTSEKFGDHIPLIRRQDVSGFVTRRPVWLMQSARPRHGAQAGQHHGGGDAGASTKGPRPARRMPASANCWTIWCRKSARTKTAPELLGRQAEARSPQARKRTKPAPAVRIADRAARLGRPDGWLGLDAGAGVCRGLRHAQQLGRVSGRPGRVAGRGHQHGIRRSAVGRWQPDRTRHPWVRGVICGADDGARRNRPHAAVLDSGFPGGDDGRCLVVVVELAVIAWIRHRYMETPPLSRRPAEGGGPGRRVGVSYGDIDWEFVGGGRHKSGRLT